MKTGSEETVKFLAIGSAILFILFLLIQILSQQFIVRLVPYLFGVGLGESTILTSFRLASLSTDASAVFGILTVIAIGAASLKENRKLVGWILFTFGIVLAIMNTLRIAAGVTGGNLIYGTFVWGLLSRYLLLAALGFFVLLPTVALGRLPKHGQTDRALFRMNLFSVAVASSLITLYFLASSASPIPSLLLAIVYNGTIFLLGLSLVFSSAIVFRSLRLVTRIASVVTGLLLSMSLAYVFYSNYFSSKIFEMTWQTSFGTPLPPGETVFFSFFLGFYLAGSVGLCIRYKSGWWILPFLGFVILASSLFLLNSLTLYVNAAVIGYEVYLSARYQKSSEVGPDFLVGTNIMSKVTNDSVPE